MDKKMEEYLKSIALPEYESPGHRQELRHKLLDEMKRRHQMATKRNLRKVIYVIAVLVGLSALALAGTKYVRKWYFVGERDGVYTFRTEPEEIASVDISPTHSIGIFNATTVIMDSESKEQAEKDLMEIDQLKAAGKRELLKVIEKEMDDGETIKIYRYKYVLSDGREITMAEGSHDERSPEEVRADLEQRKEEYEENLLRAKEEGKREIAEAFEVEIDGKVFSAYHIIYSMPDGSKVEASEGSLTEEAVRAAVGQEYDQLAKKISEKTSDEVLSAEEREIEGQKFIFTRSMIRLQDGREVIYSFGKPSENN